MLIAIVLISIMNVMIMADTNDSGNRTIAASEHYLARSAPCSSSKASARRGRHHWRSHWHRVVVIINLIGIHFDFGQQKGMLLTAALQPATC